MFTGIIQATGVIEQIEPRAGDVRLRIASGKLPLEQVKPGDSIAVSGVCLTAVELGPLNFSADVSRETLSRTTLDQARAGTPVNLELALLPTTRLGGHLVSGHVDGIGKIVEKTEDGRSWRFKVEVPLNLTRYIAEKGSVCLDGISLTVNQIESNAFSVNIVPHTLSETTLGKIKPGSHVNLEVDLIARYLEKLLLGERFATDRGGVTMALLREKGFA